MKNLAPPNIDSLIVEVRGQKVILDSDLAFIYGVPTKRLNEQVKRNARRFPQDFLFRLTAEEMEQCQRLRSQLVTLKRGRSIESPATEPDPSQIATGSPGASLKSQIATSSSTHGGRRKLPYAFTKHGAIMFLSLRKDTGYSPVWLGFACRKFFRGTACPVDFVPRRGFPGRETITL